MLLLSKEFNEKPFLFNKYQILSLVVKRHTQSNVLSLQTGQPRHSKHATVIGKKKYNVN